VTFLADESGVETSIPREGIEITMLNQVYRIATGTRDLEIDGETFEVAPAYRGELELSVAGKGGVLMVELPMSHAVPQRYMADLVPPQKIAVRVLRKQMTSGETECLWAGRVHRMRIVKQKAELAVPSDLTRALQRKLPTITTGKLCPHVLYSASCRVVSSAHRVDTTITTYSGRVFTVDTLGRASGWARGGQIVHVPTGERVTILSQIGDVITGQFGIYELRLGDAVQVFAGCNKLLTTCQQKFANDQNYGGMPMLPTRNPMLPAGFGVLEQ